MKTSVINQIKTLLGMEVKLETMKLMDGITIFEADAFETDKEVFVITEDEQKIPVPIGEYELEDGRILVVEVEGVILEVKEATTEEEVVEEKDPAKAEEEVEAKTTKKTIESIVKETFFAEIEKLEKENKELKTQIQNLSKVDEVTNEVTELSDVTPISFNPENTNEVTHMQFGSNRPKTLMDTILEKINK